VKRRANLDLASKPVIRRRVKLERKPVPTDKPSALLFLIGILALASIAWLVFVSMPESWYSEPQDLGAYVAEAYGEHATTLTLVSPDNFERILLVQDEDNGLDSTELGEASAAVLSWFESNDYIIDPRPDLDSLGTLVALEVSSGDGTLLVLDGDAVDGELEVTEVFGDTLHSLGYFAVARVVENPLGTLQLRILTASNLLWTMDIDGKIDGTFPWMTDSDKKEGIPEQDTVRSVSCSDFEMPSGVSWGPQNSLEPTAWTPTPEPDFGLSWTRASFLRPVPSTLLSPERWRMQAFPPPTSQEAPRPMWPAIRMSA